MKVFVYGTLKRGHHNNILLRNANFVGEAVVKGYKLYDHGFPVAAPCENSEVAGEVFELDKQDDFTLTRLDRLEGEGVMYKRVNVKDDIHMYVGVPGFWDNFKHLEECEKNNNQYRWE